MSRFLNVLRSWLVMVSIIAIGNTVQSFRDHSFLSEKLYTGKPGLGKIYKVSFCESKNAICILPVLQRNVYSNLKMSILKCLFALLFILLLSRGLFCLMPIFSLEQSGYNKCFRYSLIYFPYQAFPLLSAISELKTLDP